MARNARPIPPEFRSIALTMPRHKLATKYKVAQKTIQLWFEQLGIQGKWQQIAQSPSIRPMPEDFPKVAPTMTKFALCRHYRCSDRVVLRWLTEAGVQAAVYVPVPPKAKERAPGKIKTQITKSTIAATTKTIYDCAADTLRRERFTVYRCDNRGRFDLKGDYWRCGFSVMTDDELLERAAKYERRAA